MPSSALSLIYPLSLHDALPIFVRAVGSVSRLKHVVLDFRHSPIDDALDLGRTWAPWRTVSGGTRQLRFALGEDLQIQSVVNWRMRSEEHTSELQSHHDLVCRLLRSP